LFGAAVPLLGGRCSARCSLPQGGAALPLQNRWQARLFWRAVYDRNRLNAGLPVFFLGPPRSGQNAIKGLRGRRSNL